MNAAEIDIRGLRKVFRQTTTNTDVVAIDRLDLNIKAGQLVAIVGKTGCGKSTLFDILIGLQAPTGGILRIGESSPYADFDAFRGRIATIFQQDRLLPWRTASENVCLPLELLGLPLPEQQARSEQWLERLGLGRFMKAYPHELSGGMRQRVAIARAFALEAGLLLADESFSALDAVTAAELREVFVQLARETASTAILITHQLEEAIAVGERILVFGTSARLLADVRVDRWCPADYPKLQEALQQTLQLNRAHESLTLDSELS